MEFLKTFAQTNSFVLGNGLFYEMNGVIVEVTLDCCN